MVDLYTCESKTTQCFHIATRDCNLIAAKGLYMIFNELAKVIFQNAAAIRITYNSEEALVMNAYTRRKFFGRDLVQ